VLGQESLGRVLDPGPASSFRKGDLHAATAFREDLGRATPEPGPVKELVAR
jgi:hypothetical protein